MPQTTLGFKMLNNGMTALLVRLVERLEILEFLRSKFKFIKP